jgi:hypothetical protein
MAVVVFPTPPFWLDMQMTRLHTTGQVAQQAKKVNIQFHKKQITFKINKK